MGVNRSVTLVKQFASDTGWHVQASICVALLALRCFALLCSAVHCALCTVHCALCCVCVGLCWGRTNISVSGVMSLVNICFGSWNWLGWRLLVACGLATHEAFLVAESSACPFQEPKLCQACLWPWGQLPVLLEPELLWC